MNPVEHDPDMIPMIQVPQLNATSLGLPCRFSELHYPSPATLSVLPSGDVNKKNYTWNTHALKWKKKTWINQDSEKKKKSHSLQIPNKHSTTFQTHPTKSLNTRRSRICRTSAHRFRADNSAPQSSCSGGGNREAYLQVMEYKVSPVSC